MRYLLKGNGSRRRSKISQIQPLTTLKADPFRLAEGERRANEIETRRTNNSGTGDSDNQAGGEKRGRWFGLSLRQKREETRRNRDREETELGSCLASSTITRAWVGSGLALSPLFLALLHRSAVFELYRRLFRSLSRARREDRRWSWSQNAED
ncbi:hypothetical protein YC2023_009075 [Brassica napus]